MTGGGGAGRTERVFGLRRRQYVLFGALMASVVSVLLTSVVSVTAHDSELDGLYSQEADGSAMTFVQRESLGLIIELDRWARGDVTARDVQIARALLGQRLQVRTISDRTTFELVGEEYRSALVAVDEVVRALADSPVNERVSFRSQSDPVVDDFEVAARELSLIYQEITRERSAEAINRRALTEQVQAALAGLIILLGVALAGWIASDLRDLSRRTSERLRAETQRLEHARRRLEFGQRLAQYSGAWSESIASGVETRVIHETALADLRTLLPGLPLDLIADSPGVLHVVRGVPGATDDREVDVVDAALDNVDADDVESAIDRANEMLHLVGVRDQRERALDEARRFDALTGLPNRESLQPSLAAAIDRARRLRPRGVVSLALVDINRFADFNSSYGHSEGDRLLVSMARVLVSACDGVGDVIRLSADEFGIVAAHRSRSAAELAIDDLSRRLESVHLVGDEQVVVATTIGAVIDVSLDQHPDALVQRAAAALAAAQDSEPRPRVRYFEWERDEHLMEVLREESALRSALRSGEFVTHFQPIIDLETGALAACEALVRWNRPEVGVVRPGAFLPAIARAGLTVELGWQIIDNSLSAWGAERRAARGALDGVSLSINLDAAQLAVPTLADYLLNAADRSGVPVEALVVEVTEHALLVGTAALDQLERLRGAGMRVALDDFGTGYSSLAQASRLPLDVLKLDRSFLPDHRLDPQQSALIRDILSIADTLSLAVTAEGIETQEVADQLRELGVRYGQGWHFAKAMPIAELVEWAGAQGRGSVKER